MNTERTSETSEESANSKEENINELPYSKAIEVDKRSISHIFCSFIVEKMKFKWSTVKQILQILATIITTVLGTIAVQSCAPHWF